MWHLTPDMWHMTCDTWHVPYDMWHMVWGEHSLKFQLSSLTVWDLWRLEYFEEMDELMNESVNESVNELMTKGFIEQPRLHRVCL